MQRDMGLRRDKIFDIIVASYIENAEPVGSQAICRLHDLGLSSASVRNVMADLEEMGFLMQPHTSAGRVPTDKGYRYWVDFLMRPEELTAEEKEWIRREISSARTIESMVDRFSKIVSELSDNAALIYIKNLKKVSFMNHLLEELVEAERLGDYLEEEAELFIEGAFRMCGQPEFKDLRKMRLLLQAFDEKLRFIQILVKDLEEEGVQVHIGSENHADQLEDVSLVVKDCTLAGVPIGGIAVVGPTRMRYAKIVSVVDFVADRMSEALRRF